ncbi:uncharacterized protein LOC115443913 [Manduca sexta]|nr:uncharacterized protein LOC115443913 [Manduca sexta]
MNNAILKLLSVLIWLRGVFADDCEVEYEAAFNEDICSCNNFDNKIVNFEGLKLSGSESGESDRQMSMKGIISLSKEIEEGNAVQIEIYKETDLGNKEFVNGARWDICQNLHNTDAPWYPLLECLGISECPILAKDYAIEELFISLDSVKNVMTHEFCGDYEVHLCLVDDLETLSCHIVNLAIVETLGENCKR